MDVFVSSIQHGYEEIRASVRRAVESLGMRPLMAELAGGSPASPQRALLDLVDRCDIFLLLVGPRYSKPTRDEFVEAQRLGKTVLVLRQSVDLEPEQAEFLEDVAGGWSGGRMWGTFTDASDVALAAVQTITNAQSSAKREQLEPAAQERVRDLLGDRSPGFGAGPVVKVGFVPLVTGPLLDVVALEDRGLADGIADAVRANRIVAQDVGIETTVSRNGIAVQNAGSRSSAATIAFVGVDGAILCEMPVGGTGTFGSMRVDPQRLEEALQRAGAFALEVWPRVDSREDVQQVAVLAAIPGAQNMVFGAGRNQNSMSMGWGLPQIVYAPEPPAVVRRADVGGERLTRRIVAEMRRVFADARAVDE